MDRKILDQAKKNLIWNWILLLFGSVVNFLLRKLLIDSLGIEYAGLGGLFSSVLSFLNLAEMGVSSSVMYFLYKPVAQGDTEKIRRLLGLMVYYYRRIGLIVLGAGLAVMPFLRFLIAGTVPEGVNLYEIYLLSLASSVLPYWIYAEKSVLLSVHQRSDIINRIFLVTDVIQFAFQALALCFFRSYYLYMIVSVCSVPVRRIIIARKANTRYPLYREKLEPDGEMKQKVREKIRGITLHKLGGVIVNSADSIVISALLGLRPLGMYQNYYSILYRVLLFVRVFSTAPQAGIGELSASGDKEKLYNAFENFTFLSFCIGTFCSCCFLCLYQPFITLWVGKDMLLDGGTVLLFCVYFFVLNSMAPGNLFENVCGIWNRDKWRPLLEGLLNLTLNIVLSRFIGLYGILLSTIISIAFFSLPWLYRNVMRFIFPQKSLRRYFLRQLGGLLLAAIICGAVYGLCLLIPPYLPNIAVLLLRAVICVCGTLSVLFLIYNKTEKGKWLLSLFAPAKKP